MKVKQKLWMMPVAITSATVTKWVSMPLRIITDTSVWRRNWEF
jgi:hypothetical protein